MKNPPQKCVAEIYNKMNMNSEKEDFAKNIWCDLECDFWPFFNDNFPIWQKYLHICTYSIPVTVGFL
jgi:hypothetical protein